jgi:hypothetical protein
VFSRCVEGDQHRRCDRRQLVLGDLLDAALPTLSLATVERGEEGAPPFSSRGRRRTQGFSTSPAAAPAAGGMGNSGGPCQACTYC